ncbi:hypothetical protein ACQEVB_29215 [Pseudonocardia sp. CA-107938]|uniref:hypothetical protein n=1 Tax=Pseudonocardia sp. CA-107938 TaxID=3240021 RepID=UPI003D8D9C31
MNPGYASLRDAPRVRVRRPSGVTHTMVALCAWAVAAVVTLAVAGETKIGPVVFTLTKTHGLHAGDVVAAVLMSLFALTVTICVVVHYWAASRRARRSYGDRRYDDRYRYRY